MRATTRWVRALVAEDARARIVDLAGSTTLDDVGGRSGLRKRVRVERLGRDAPGGRRSACRSRRSSGRRENERRHRYRDRAPHRSTDQPRLVPSMYAAGVPPRSPVHEGAFTRAGVGHVTTYRDSGLDRDSRSRTANPGSRIPNPGSRVMSAPPYFSIATARSSRSVVTSIDWTG